MKRGTGAILIVIGVFLLVVCLNFIFFVDSRDNDENEWSGSRSSYRGTPYGTLGLYTLLEESGYPVSRFEGPYTELPKQADLTTLLVISPPEQHSPSEEEFGSLVAWIQAGGTVIIVDRDIRITLGDLRCNTKPASPVSQPKPLQPTIYTRGVDQIELSMFSTRLSIEGSAPTVHFGDEYGAVLVDARMNNGHAVFLTDPYIIANNGIIKADNLAVALNLLEKRPAGRIAFDEYHHGYGRTGLLGNASGGVLSYFSGTPIPWMLGQGVLIGLFVIYTKGRRFARPLPKRKDRRTTNLEFVSSMANIVRLAQARDLAMENVYLEFRRKLCRFASLPSKVDSRALAKGVARRGRIDPMVLNRLLTRCEKVTEGYPTTDAELLRLVDQVRQMESDLEL